MGLLSWIVFGALAGWVAGLIVKDKRGCVINIVVGVLGALLGGFIYRLATGDGWNFEFNLTSFGVAVLGSLLLLLIVAFIPRR